MRKHSDIIGYMYIDTEQTIKDATRREIIAELKDKACDACKNGYGIKDEDGQHRSRCMPALKAAYMLKEYFAVEV